MGNIVGSVIPTIRFNKQNNRSRSKRGAFICGCGNSSKSNADSSSSSSSDEVEKERGRQHIQDLMDDIRLYNNNIQTNNKEITDRALQLQKANNRLRENINKTREIIED